MRMENICDSMNVSGCDKLQNQSGFPNFIYNYQIEIAVIFAVIVFSIGFYWFLKTEVKK